MWSRVRERLKMSTTAYQMTHPAKKAPVTVTTIVLYSTDGWVHLWMGVGPPKTTFFRLFPVAVRLQGKSVCANGDRSGYALRAVLNGPNLPCFFVFHPPFPIFLSPRQTSKPYNFRTTKKLKISVQRFCWYYRNKHYDWLRMLKFILYHKLYQF